MNVNISQKLGLKIPTLIGVIFSTCRREQEVGVLKNSVLPSFQCLFQ
jgi:hypothetical protein